MIHVKHVKIVSVRPLNSVTLVLLKVLFLRVLNICKSCVCRNAGSKKFSYLCSAGVNSSPADSNF